MRVLLREALVLLASLLLGRTWIDLIEDASVETDSFFVFVYFDLSSVSTFECVICSWWLLSRFSLFRVEFRFTCDVCCPAGFGGFVLSCEIE